MNWRLLTRFVSTANAAHRQCICFGILLFWSFNVHARCNFTFDALLSDYFPPCAALTVALSMFVMHVRLLEFLWITVLCAWLDVSVDYHRSESAVSFACMHFIFGLVLATLCHCVLQSLAFHWPLLLLGFPHRAVLNSRLASKWPGILTPENAIELFLKTRKRPCEKFWI